MFFKKKVKATSSTEPPAIGSRAYLSTYPNSGGATYLNHALINTATRPRLEEQQRSLLRRYKKENPLKLADIMPALVAAHMADPDCTVDFVLEKDALRFVLAVNVVIHDSSGHTTRIARQFADINAEYY